jgi:DNA-binding NtrC family response regulator
MSSNGYIRVHHLPANIIPIHNNNNNNSQSNKDNPFNVKEIVGRVEKELIVSALATYNNRTNAMKALGISRRAFYDKLRRYGIEV